MKKKFNIFLLIVFVLGLNLTGCKKTQEIKENNIGDSVSQSKSDYLGLVMNSSGEYEGSLSQSSLRGLKKAEEELGFKVEYLESDTSDSYRTNIEYFTDCALDMLFCAGYEMADDVEEFASAHPDEHYAILNYSFDENINNILCIEFEDNQVAFEAGYLAAYQTKTNRLGFLGSFRSEEMDAYEFGFKAGVALAAKELGKEIFVEVDYIDSFDDEDLAKKDADKLYDAGADIIYHAVGKASSGVIESARAHRTFVIGSEIDQNNLAPEVFLASTIRNVEDVVYNIAKEIKEAKQVSDVTGKTKFLGIKDGAVKIELSKNNMIPEELIKKLGEIEQAIIEDKIDSPYEETTYEEYIKNI
ncbi:MAG: BMP family ABC transporter substrate-binding protein [Oscillospiraceae bacterium]|nr:BMP family ABC transporter substrate-binding protein [Oscillospiraceae bacterium]